MKKLNKYQLLNIIIFVAYTILFIFETCKVCYWGSHRELCQVDYVYIATSIEFFVCFLLLFIFSWYYEKENRFRKTSLIFFCICSIITPFRVAQKVSDFKQLFIATDYYTPVFVDKFTTLFELCYISIFVLLIFSYFIYLLKNKHFNKSQTSEMDNK